MKSSKSANKERALFLKQLASDPGADIHDLSEKLGIHYERAMQYVKSFVATAAAERDSIRTRAIMNQGVDQEFGLLENEVDALKPLIIKYGDQIPNLSQPQPPSDASPFYEHDDNSQRIPPAPAAVSVPQHVEPTTAPATENPVYDYGSFNVETLNKGYNYAFMADLNRVGLMRWVLQGVPIPPPNPKIENFIRYFELNQDALMVTPDTLTRELQGWFGDKTGDNAGRSFASYIQHLKPDEQFGVRKMEGLRKGYTLNQPQNPAMYGQQFQDPFNTYYHSQGVLMFGMDARSPDARRLIWEYDQEKRKEKEAEKKRNQVLEDLRTKIQLEMSSFWEGAKNGKGGAGMFGAGGQGDAMSQLMPMLVMSGKFNMVPYIDSEGQNKFRIEPNPNANGNGNAAMMPMHDPNSLTSKDMLDFMTRMYELVSGKDKDLTSFKDTLLSNALNKLDSRGSVANELLELNKVYKEMVPQTPPAGNQGDPIEYARILLEKDKFISDRERADRLIDRQFDAKTKLQTMEFEREKEAMKTRNTLIKSVSQILATNIPTIFQFIMMLTGKGGSLGGAGGGGALGGLGGLGNILGGLMGAGGGGGGLGGLGANNDEDDDEGSAPGSASGGGGGGFDMGNLVGMINSMMGGGGMGSQPAASSSGPQVVAPSAAPPQNFAGIPRNANLENIIGQPKIVSTTQKPGMNSVASGYSMYDDLSGMQPPQETTIPTYYPPQPQPQTVAPAVRNDYQGAVSNTLRESSNVVREVQSQPQPQKQQEEEEDEYPIYTPNDFAEHTEEEIQHAREKSKKALESVNSYIASVEAAAKKTKVIDKESL